MIEVIKEIYSDFAIDALEIFQLTEHEANEMLKIIESDVANDSELN